MTDQSFFSVRLHLKCDGTCAETRFRLSAKRTSPFKSVVVSVQSTTGSRGVRISASNGGNVGYTMFQGSVKGNGYPLDSPVSPFTSPPVRHRVPSCFNQIIPTILTLNTRPFEVQFFASVGGPLNSNAHCGTSFPLLDDNNVNLMRKQYPIYLLQVNTIFPAL